MDAGKKKPPAMGRPAGAAGHNVTRTESLTAADAVPSPIVDVDPPSLGEGLKLGSYTIHDQLGAGGMGEVYSAQNIDTGEWVALKYSKSTGAQNLLRFKREFRALADVRHENLVTLGELVMLSEEQLFFTMELLEGVTLMKYLRGNRAPGELPNLVRLRRAMRQLIAGVSALHDAGWLHRDIKPSNVIVTRQGRLVLLDFGLVRDADTRASDVTKEGELLGTPAYMAPEQAAGQKSTPATDYYAIGTVLFEALTGHRPFGGRLLNLIRQKREDDAPSPQIHVDGIPAPLLDICVALLARDPGKRPGPSEILTALGGDYTPYVDQLKASRKLRRALFVGRDPELGRLRAAYEALRSVRQGSTIHVHGPSGFGKSTLATQFLKSLDDPSHPLVLRGRCLDRESVPYKGVDSVVDALATELRNMPDIDAAGVLPRHVGALARVFPVLDSVPVVAHCPPLRLQVEGRELRSMAFAALREMLSRIADRRPLVMFVDDFQWADVESAELIADLLRPPDPPALVLLLSYRDDDASLNAEALEHLRRERARSGAEVIDMVVGPLPVEQAQELAGELIGKQGAFDDDTIDDWIEASGGSPYYLQELVRGSDRTLSPTALDQLVIQRILALPDSARTLLEVFSVAGGPLDPDTATEVLDEEFPVSDLERLREDDLLRTAEGKDLLLEPEHDRIREAVVGELDPDRLADIHLALGEALENRNGDAEALAEHFERGGLLAKAATYAAQAARQAAAALAFDRAVKLAQRALDLRATEDDAEIDGLRELLAENLIGAGRGQEASELLLDLAARREGGDATELKTRAADCLIKAGKVREGLVVLDELFVSMGMRLPRSKLGALKSFLVERTLSLFRKPSPPESNGAGADELAGARADLCFAAVCGLSTQEVMLGTFLEARLLRESLKSGDHHRIARAYAIHSTLEVQMGRSWAQASTYHEQAEELARQFKDPKLDGYLKLCEGCAHWLERRYSIATQILGEGAEVLERAPHAAWERAATHNFRSYARLMLGEYKALRGELARHVALARERGDVHELVDLSTTHAQSLLYSGNVRAARNSLEESQVGWDPNPYRISHLWILYANVPLAIYEGQGLQAMEACEDAFVQMRKVFLDRASHVMQNGREIHARSCLAAASTAEHPEPMLAKARKQGRRIEGTENPVLEAQSQNILAGVAALENRRDEAIQRWQRAASLFVEHGMRGYAAAIHHRLAQLVESDQAHTYSEMALEFFSLEEVREPARFVAVFAPGPPMVDAPPATDSSELER
jgi:serine/threonine protein kinase